MLHKNHSKNKIHSKIYLILDVPPPRSWIDSGTLDILLHEINNTSTFYEDNIIIFKAFRAVVGYF